MDNKTFLAAFIEEISDKLETCNTDYGSNLLKDLLVDQTELIGKSVRFFDCMLCNGSGSQQEFEDSWDCPGCLGLGGKYIEHNPDW